MYYGGRDLLEIMWGMWRIWGKEWKKKNNNNIRKLIGNLSFSNTLCWLHAGYNPEYINIITFQRSEQDTRTIYPSTTLVFVYQVTFYASYKVLNENGQVQFTLLCTYMHFSISLSFPFHSWLHHERSDLRVAFWKPSAGGRWFNSSSVFTKGGKRSRLLH